jgi:hypothetical protein
MGSKVVMMPMPMQQVRQMNGATLPETVGPAVSQAGFAMVRQMNGAMLPETVGPAVSPTGYAMVDHPLANQMSAARQPGSPIYAQTQQFADSSPSFRDVCSPTYQTGEAYERYVKDIMNAEGDDFQFDWPRTRPQNLPHGNVMMAEKSRMPESEVSTDEGAWSYASDASNPTRWYNSQTLVMTQ